MKISVLPGIDYFALGAPNSLCYQLTLVRENKHFPSLHKWVNGYKRDEVIFQQVSDAGPGEGLHALVNPEEGLQQPHRSQKVLQEDGRKAAKKWIAATLLLTKLETI